MTEVHIIGDLSDPVFRSACWRIVRAAPDRPGCRELAMLLVDADPPPERGEPLGDGFAIQPIGDSGDPEVD